MEEREREEGKEPGVPYIPQELPFQQEIFQQALLASGRTLLRHRSLATDRLVLRQRWLVTPQGTPYDEQAFYQAFDQETFRRALRSILTQSLLSVADLAFLPAEQWRFLEEQEFLRTVSSLSVEPEKRPEQAVWERGPACQGIADLGRTLEWYVAEWFRRTYHAVAYHGVEIQELPCPGDLDVVALYEGLCILVECKSSSHIEEQKLRLLLQRSNALHPDLTLLLIDTPSVASIEMRTRQLCQLLDLPYDAAYRQCMGQVFFQVLGPQNLYIATTGTSISTTLAAVTHFHEALRQVRLYHR